jgi:hypothetical protein
MRSMVEGTGLGHGSHRHTRGATPLHHATRGPRPRFGEEWTKMQRWFNRPIRGVRLWREAEIAKEWQNPPL